MLGRKRPWRTGAGLLLGAALLLSVPQAAAAAPGGAGEPWLPIAVGAGLLALLLVALLAVRSRELPRLRTGAPAIVPLGKGLELEGESADPEIGRFSGTAYAVQIPDLRDPEKRAHDSRLYVLDPKRDLPFWVSYGEVHTPLPADLQAHPRPWELQGSLRPGASVLGYVTVPTTYPERHAELFEQLESIEALCKRRRFRLVAVVRDEDPAAKATLERPGIAYALEQFASEKASALVVCDVARLGRSQVEIDQLLGRLSGEGVSLLTLDPELDTSTEAGKEAVRTIALRGRRADRWTRGSRAAVEAQGAPAGGRSSPSRDLPGGVPAVGPGGQIDRVGGAGGVLASGERDAAGASRSGSRPAPQMRQTLDESPGNVAYPPIAAKERIPAYVPLLTPQRRTMELRRELIERRDFPQVRRGHDPEAVNEHLREVAKAVEELRHSKGSADSTATHVRSIIEAAERASTELEQSARIDAERMRSGAKEEAESRLTSARNEAETTLTSARAEAKSTLDSARSEAAATLASAKEESEKTVTNANASAHQTLSSAKAEAETTLTTAKAEADKMVTGANASAHATLSSAKTQAEKTVSEANASAETTLSRAKSESERMLTSARNEADKTLSNARAEAASTRASSRAEAQAHMERVEQAVMRLLERAGLSKASSESSSATPAARSPHSPRRFATEPSSSAASSMSRARSARRDASRGPATTGRPAHRRMMRPPVGTAP